MTDSERDSIAAYGLVLQAARWRMLLSGDLLARDEDTVDLFLLKALKRKDAP